MNCPGSVRMSEGITETPSPFAAEGTAAHMLAERCLSAGHDAVRFRGWLIDTAKGTFVAGTLAPDGKTVFRVDDEMIDAVQLYLDVARGIADESDEFEIEERMDMSDLVAGVFGTGDAIAYRSQPTRRVTIADLKYGKGVAVDVEENEQLLTYAIGVAQRFHNRGVDEVELVVVQPRAPHIDGPVRRWTTDMVGLVEHVAALQSAAAEAAKPDAPLRSGDWCKFCKAAGICPELRSTVDRILGAVRMNGEILEMADPTKIAFRDWKLEETELNLVKNFVKRREEFAHSEAMAGRMPPGAKLVGKRAVRKWRDETNAIDTLRLAGVADDDLFETSLRSPAQVEKSVPKKERGVIEELAIKTSSGTVLAPLSDPRPAVDPNDASGFDAVTIND
jgi:hypothetical protein